LPLPLTKEEEATLALITRLMTKFDGDGPAPFVPGAGAMQLPADELPAFREEFTLYEEEREGC
jgi:hypothetical protein